MRISDWSSDVCSSDLVGVRLVPIYGRQTFKVDGKLKFLGGVTVESWGGGEGLVQQETQAAQRLGVEIAYATRALSLITEGDRVVGVRVRRNGEMHELRCSAVVLASGGFEANSEWRTRYLWPGWELAKVRGTRFHTGDGIRMALVIGRGFGRERVC